MLPWCEDSPTALEALRAGGQPIASSCSGATVCGRCGVFVIEGGESLPPADATEEAVLRVMGAGGADERLACRLPRGAIDTQIVLRTNYW
ncbi:MAG: (2Fe-2S)-binding protein [Deltaproteobacteria bacterium]|nr:(2Fe-2S)-binding protein [Deltaproteobacteria bacterium]